MLSGRLATYSPARRLVAFICEPSSPVPAALHNDLPINTTGSAIVFVPGLTDGFLAASYVQPLAEAVVAA